jgi:hypothetical protein
VNDNLINFDNLLKEVLNGSFYLSPTATFRKVVNANPADNAKQQSSRVSREGNNRDKKKRKSKNRNGNLIGNMSPDNDFKASSLLQDCPTWEDK